MTRTSEVQVFSVPKVLSWPAENEDAYEIVPGDVGIRSFALADGATQTLGAGLWARLLVKKHAEFLSLVSETSDVEAIGAVHVLNHAEAWLQPLRDQWLEDLTHELGPDIHHWSMHNKLLEGAYATFLAVGLTPAEAGACHWHALALGDTSFFVVQGGELAARLPYENAESFGSHPSMFGTRGLGLQGWRETLGLRTGVAAAGSWLFAMTDALGKWFLTQEARGEKPWEVLLELTEQDQFTRWVVERRAQSQLDTDDTTLLFTQV